ncbi:MAG TPA: DUF47 family protein, partial [Burkholderiaceae bacterium]|nr:DUF47 family protein [Burkholderiaceae bacterium]
FVLFNQQAELSVEALSALVDLLRNVSDPDGRVRDIEAIEKRGDGVVAEIRALVARSFFPPFSREAVLGLMNRFDDILDLVEDAAQSIHLYHVTRITPEALRLAELAVESARKLKEAALELERMDRPGAIVALCGEVDMLEAQADHVMRAAMSRLFRDEPDTRQLVKLKAIYELLEALTDRCKDADNEIEAIVLRYG